jgi:hypothetical protein
LGALEIWLAAPGVVVQRVRGHAGLKIAQAISDFNDRLILSGVHPLIFDDWMELSGYSTEARVLLTAWAIKRRSGIRGIHVLVKSKLVAMGLAIANTATGGLAKTYASRLDFEEALGDAIRAAK